MKIFIDADGCPVVKETVRLAQKHSIECLIICDTAHRFEYDGIQTVTVEKGADSVDFKIINLVNDGDIVVTQDYGLAAMCIARKAVPITQNGLVISNENIDMLLFNRYLSRKIRNAGMHLKGPPKRDKKADQIFEEKLENLIIKLIDSV